MARHDADTLLSEDSHVTILGKSHDYPTLLMCWHILGGDSASGRLSSARRSGQCMVWAWHHSQGRVKELVWAWHQSQGRVEGTGVGGSPYCWHEHKHTLLLPSTLLPQPLSRERIPLLAGHSAHYNALLSSGVSSPGLIAQYISLPVPLLFLSRCMEHC